MVARKKPRNKAMGRMTLPRVIGDHYDDRQGNTFVRRSLLPDVRMNVCDRCGKKAREDDRVDVVIVDDYERFRHVACRRRGEDPEPRKMAAPASALPRPSNVRSNICDRCGAVAQSTDYVDRVWPGGVEQLRHVICPSSPGTAPAVPALATSVGKTGSVSPSVGTCVSCRGALGSEPVRFAGRDSNEQRLWRHVACQPPAC